MIAIHPVHRRIAELTIIAEQKKGFDRLAAAEKRLDEALRWLKAEREQAKRPG